MVMLCFVLDLRSLSPPLLRDLKQSLLQLANFYAVSASIGQRSCSKSLSDRIGLCYILKDRISCLDELNVAYTPGGNFNLRDFHHAVNNLPNDVFLPELNDSGALSYCDMKLTSILGNVILYSCGGHEKDVARKVILISSCVVKNLDSVMKEALMDAADNCISVEFLFLEQQSSHLGDLSENISKFVKHISDLENCSFHAYLPANHIIDEFIPCQTCRCHGIPLDDAFGKQNKLSSSCPVEGNDLETCDVIETSVTVGEHTVLFLPSFQHCMKLQQVSMPVDLNVIERINLGSLSEVFLGLCSALHTLDQGLVCSSKCNIETMREVLFLCYYILLPSEKGLMLLRMEVRDYNPFLHERGFHQKLTLLVKESLQFGSVCPNLKDMMSPNSTRHDFSEDAVLSKPTANVVAIEEEIPELNLTVGEESEDTAAACITEEWEQMIINETPKISSPSFMSKPKFDQLVLSPQDGCRQLDEKTSRILERLEVPRELKRKASFLKSSSIGADSCVPTKAPLIPFQANRGLDQVAMSSQPMKPNFQKLKRRQR
ncbi:hypothetical protein Acr_26g0005530 [Actinidia rufa]|uniref:Uncharacterized protein n=1 Tax=Actinidia rufa TaxID=165716 RepID=A0A7J0H2F6_9ERIC|nr:hypothetical protein Acr_26g0005530 [Actinidia rufa]